MVLTRKYLILQGLLKKTDYNAKITDIEGKTPSSILLATTSAFNAAENKIPKVSNLVKKTYYDERISDVESKYLTTSGYNRFTTCETLSAKIKEKGLVYKSDIPWFIDNPDLDKK